MPAGPVIGDSTSSPATKPCAAAQVADLVDGAAADASVADHAALADLVAADLELRLDERDDRLARRRAQQLGDARQDERQRDERDVDDREVARLGDEREIDVADVLALEHDDARVLAERPRELAVADVDRVDPRGAAAEQHVGEAAGRRADVERDHARRDRSPNASSPFTSLSAPRETYG